MQIKKAAPSIFAGCFVEKENKSTYPLNRFL
jgi:hypothetical protein